MRTDKMMRENEESPDNKLDIRVVLFGNTKNIFEEIKNTTGFNNNTEVLRFIINDYYKVSQTRKPEQKVNTEQKIIQNEIDNKTENLNLDQVYNTINQWAKVNLTNAILHLKNASEFFTYHEIGQISRVWWKNGLQTIDARLEINFNRGTELHASFQLNRQGEVVGFNLRKQINNYI